MLCLSTRTLLPLALALSASGASRSSVQIVAPRVEAIRFWSFGDVTRIAIQTRGEYKLVKDQIEHPSRVYFDLNGLRPPSTLRHGLQTVQVGDRQVKQIRIAEVSPKRTRIVFDLLGPVEMSSSQLVNPDRLIIEFRPRGTSLPALTATRSVIAAPASSPAAADRSPSTQVIKTFKTADGLVVNRTTPSEPTSPAASTPEAPPPVTVPPTTPARGNLAGIASPAKRRNSNDSSLVRVFGLKLGRVVIDAGHGGHDTGTIGPNGLMEKELVLDVALRLGKLVTEQLGTEVIYTRPDDTFIPLEDRTKIANRERADLFISIHANSSPEPTATGVETYFFNFNSDKSGLELATRENATSSSSISDLNDLLHKAVLKAKLAESRAFAEQVQKSLWTSSVKMNTRSRDRGVRQAPFVVLIGATMPSILAEIGFVSNPHDEKLLRRTQQRQTIADALLKGVLSYANTLSHVQMARSGTE
jgi:N-acetylmuramoyl-L-alanine amidase